MSEEENEQEYTPFYTESLDYALYTAELAQRASEINILERPFKVFIHNGTLYPAFFLDLFPCAFMDTVAEVDEEDKRILDHYSSWLKRIITP